MPPTIVAPSPLYTSPQDIFDLLSTEGGQLRLDDHNLATGQTVVVTANAAIGDTTLFVQPLQYPLIAGSVLEFDGGGVPAVVEVIVGATSPVGTTSLTVVALQAPVAALAQAYDNGVNAATAQRLVKGCWYGTGKVNDYCLNRYDATALVGNPTVNEWATAIAAKWVASRRGNTPPASVLADAKSAIDDLKQVRMGNYNIGGVGTRTSGWPFLSNITLDLGYTYAKLRVEQPISELTPTQYGQFIDWGSALFIEW